MDRLQQILREKGRQVFSIGKEATALDAALLMNDEKIGALLVLEGEQLIGIVTERDILRRVVAEQQAPGETFVEDIMTTDIACATNETTLEEARSVMKNRRIRHLPVLDENEQVQGMVSIGDLNAWCLDGQEQTIHFLREYMHGRV